MRRWTCLMPAVLVAGTLLVWAGVALAAEGNSNPAADVTIRGDALVSVSGHEGAVSVTILPGWRTADRSTISVDVKDKVRVVADPPCMMFADAPDIE